jgi:hypothetical protein
VKKNPVVDALAKASKGLLFPSKTMRPLSRSCGTTAAS